MMSVAEIFIWFNRHWPRGPTDSIMMIAGNLKKVSVVINAKIS